MTKMDRVARGPPILAAAATVTLVISVELKLMRQNLPIKELAHQVVWCDWNYINETVKQVLSEPKKPDEIQILFKQNSANLHLFSILLVMK